jgi:plasmid segregation protein ParM
MNILTTIIEHVVSLDHGNGWVKARGNKKKIVRPSYIGELAKVGTSYSDVEDLRLEEYTSGEYKGETYVWGDDIKNVNESIPTYSQNNRYTNKFYQLVSLFAIYEALGTGKKFENVLVVTGVPSNEKGSEAESELIEGLVGTHFINGKRISIVEVVVLPQPLGTVMSLYLDDEGFIADSKFQNSLVGVIDVGTGTSDLDIIQNLRRLDEYESVPFGMMDIYKNIAKHLKSQGVRNVDIPKVEEGWSLGVYKQSERNVVSFSEYKKKAVEDVFKQLEAKINIVWKDLKRFDRLIITGGGAKIFEKSFDKYINDVYDIPKHPQIANSEGFYNFGKYVQAMRNGE